MQLNWQIFGRSILCVFVLLIVIQLIPIKRDNPPAPSSSSIYTTGNVPPDVHSVLDRSCNNCHSNQTVWPWYSYVAPFSWILAHDVHQARTHMNFSEWSTYSPKKREEKLEEICEQVMNGVMPDGKYLLIHRKAKLTQEQRESICTWTQSVPIPD
jgi:hypothetical protein